MSTQRRQVSRQQCSGMSVGESARLTCRLHAGEPANHRPAVCALGWSQTPPELLLAHALHGGTQGLV